MQLRRNKKEMEMKTRKIEGLEKDIEAFDVNNLNKKQRELEREQEDLKNQVTSQITDIWKQNETDLK